MVTGKETKQTRLEYIQEKLAALVPMAKEADAEMLAYVIEMAVAEAHDVRCGRPRTGQTNPLATRPKIADQSTGTAVLENRCREPLRQAHHFGNLRRPAHARLPAQRHLPRLRRQPRRRFGALPGSPELYRPAVQMP